MRRAPSPARVSLAGFARRSLLAFLAFTAVAGASPAAARPMAQKLDPAKLGRQPAAIRDRVIGPGATSALQVPVARVPAGGLDARYPVGDGRTVRVILSAVYEPDPQVSQSVATFLGTLLHGGEIVGVTVYLATPDELGLACGVGAEACFNSATNLIVMPAVPPPSGISQEDILSHEYGHALANGRSNYPFPAVALGTKRWATYEQVCRRFVGALGDPAAVLPYRDLPGEAFADSYRLLNGGSPALFVFNRSFFPDATDFRLIRADVLNPWHQRPPAVHRGAGDRRMRIATPLDGLLRVKLVAAPGSDYDLTLTSPLRRQPIAVGTRRGRVDELATLICGVRGYSLQVRRHSGRGPYRMTVSRP